MIQKKSLFAIFILGMLFIVGLLLRLYHLNWDSNTHLHPDERFLTMVSTAIHFPSSLSAYFNTPTSPLNPTNYPDYQFFVYGTFPLFLTRFFGEILGMTSYDQIHLLGRFFSALMDSSVIVGLYFLSRSIFAKSASRTVFIPSILYAFSVLPLQLSHYYAVDTYLSGFLFFTFLFLAFFLIKQKSVFVLLAGGFFGLALASKISALYFVPIVLLFLSTNIFLLKPFKLAQTFFFGLIFALSALACFRIFQPYAFTGLFRLNPVFVENLQTLASQSQPNVYFPPSVQWLSKTKIIFPLQNLIFWGMGLPAFILLLLSFVPLIKKPHFTFTSTHLIVYLAATWIIFLFFFQGTRFTFAMRYFLPLYPFVYFLIGYLYSSQKLKLPFYLLTGLHLLWGFAFLNIYSHLHSRIVASVWIYNQIPVGSAITNEYWDDPLPLYLPGGNPYIYQGQMLPLYDPDAKEKWLNLNPIITQADYLITSSNRLWGSIPKVPHLYPETSQFYSDLFDGLSPHKLIYRHTTYPGFPLGFMKSCLYIGSSDYPYRHKQNRFIETDSQCRVPGIYFRDDTADESFTVYDHPQINIFQRQ